MLLDLTIAIPVKNEEKNLPGCLDAIGINFVKSVIIIDSGSTDDTKLIAKNWGAKTIDFVWNGVFPKKRNWFLQTHLPDTKWILFLDADEYLTDNFKKELREALQSEDNVGYWLNYSIYFMGKELKGGYPLKKLALFRTGSGQYERIDEELWSKLDMEIHEHPVLNGRTGELRSKINHRDYNKISRYIYKHNEYAKWEAARFIKMSDNKEISSGWTWKQRLKYKLMGSVWSGPIFFLGSFLGLGGFRDGSRGLSFAIMKMSYFNQIYCMIREHRKPAKDID